MNAITGNGTLDRIQQEIKETLQREEELKKEYCKEPNMNGASQSTPSPKPNGLFRRFAPSPATKGVMQKFLRMRGKLTSIPQHTKIVPLDLYPAKLTPSDKPPRNGFVSTEEKMRRELQEFQRREAELRDERRKSQPDLMAALEDSNNLLQPCQSMMQLPTGWNNGGLRTAKSLAELCDASDEELEMPGTHSLILQFEKMRQARA